MSSIAKRLWKESEPLARACLEHSFVRGLGDGTLPRAHFQEYIAQDACFLEAFARAYALALANAPDQEGIYTFAELVAGVLEELKLHGGYAKKWGVELKNMQPGAATLAYTDFLLAAARTGDVGATCAAMTPCMRLYAYLGQSLSAEQDGDHDYTEWITTYSDPGFEELAAKLEELLDRYGNGSREVRHNYRRAMELELAFFEANA